MSNIELINKLVEKGFTDTAAEKIVSLKDYLRKCAESAKENLDQLAGMLPVGDQFIERKKKETNALIAEQNYYLAKGAKFSDGEDTVIRELENFISKWTKIFKLPR